MHFELILLVVIGFVCSLLFMRRFSRTELQVLRSLVRIPKNVALRKTKRQSFTYSLPFFTLIGLSHHNVAKNQDYLKSALYHELGHKDLWDQAVIFLALASGTLLAINGVMFFLQWATGCTDFGSLVQYAPEGVKFNVKFWSFERFVASLFTTAALMTVFSKRVREFIFSYPPHFAFFAIFFIMSLVALARGIQKQLIFNAEQCYLPSILAKIESAGSTLDAHLQTKLYWSLFAMFMAGLAVVLMSRFIHRREFHADFNAIHLSGDEKINDIRLKPDPWDHLFTSKKSIVTRINRFMQPTREERLAVLNAGFSLSNRYLFIFSMISAALVVHLVFLGSLKVTVEDNSINHLLNFPSVLIVIPLIVALFSYLIGLLVSTRRWVQGFLYVFGASVGFTIGAASIQVLEQIVFAKTDQSIFHSIYEHGALGGLTALYLFIMYSMFSRNSMHWFSYGWITFGTLISTALLFLVHNDPNMIYRYDAGVEVPLVRASLFVFVVVTVVSIIAGFVLTIATKIADLIWRQIKAI